MMKKLYDILSLQFELADFESKRSDLAFCKVKASQAISLLTHLRDIHGYTHLVMLTCVDWLEDKQFQLTYLLHNYATKTDLGILVFIDRDHPVMDSLHHLWKQGRVYQRELHEMFGIDFPGSPGVEEPMILEGWQGPPPMRRDFDTKAYSDETYSHRPRVQNEPEQHMKEQLYSED
ncbi:MAG: NADH-quinone oxidoreductase subunit C [Candidatus Cloacimonetes bacterium HGW-Cloacimonetes-3]|nr:MAG: NADH-quinone oxidoreductase subunit C [Candidatus Cloacimonetes bacterium HGW-Cloacimonetes-3]